MERKIFLSIAFALSLVLASLTSLDSTVKAQQNGRRLNYDTGVVTLGQNQILRVTVSVISGNDNTGVRLRRMSYNQQVCNGGICRLLGDFDGSGDTGGTDFLISSNEAVWIDLDRPPGASGVRALVTSNKPVRVNMQIVDTTTGNTASLISASEVDTW